MRCPICSRSLEIGYIGNDEQSFEQGPFRSTTLQEIKNRIEIDRCPACKAIWYDKKELHLAIEDLLTIRTPPRHEIEEDSFILRLLLQLFPTPVKEKPSPFDLAKNYLCPRCTTNLHIEKSQPPYLRCSQCDGVYIYQNDLRAFIDKDRAKEAIDHEEFN